MKKLKIMMLLLCAITLCKAQDTCASKPVNIDIKKLMHLDSLLERQKHLPGAGGIYSADSCDMPALQQYRPNVQPLHHLEFDTVRWVSSFGTASCSTLAPYATFTTANSLGFINMQETHPRLCRCLYRSITGWHKGFVELMDGCLRNGMVSWSPEYAPAAVGFFDNVFLDQKRRRFKGRVMQVIFLN